MAFTFYKKKLFDPKSDQPFELSRTKIDMFFQCPRCFYLDRRLGVSRPSMPAFTLNNAVDGLLKKEFDLHRKDQTTPEILQKYHIDAVPFNHPDMDSWRDNFKGVRFYHIPTNFEVFGAIDDLWIDKQGKIMVVDYKATSTEREISLEDKWKQGYKRQMEIYQWLLKNNGFNVSDTGYFLFCNANAQKPHFNSVLEFDTMLLSHKGDTSWVDGLLLKAKECLMSDAIPSPSPDCEYCQYAENIKKKAC